MESDEESRPTTKEQQESFLPSEPIPEIHFTDGASCRFNVEYHKNTELVSVTDYTKNELREEQQYYVIPIFNIFKITVNKTLFPLRIALFLWYGAGKVMGSYLTVFMKQKGLSLVEFSSVFSVTFIFQYLTVFASGIIADKLGNAKPVLMTHLVIVLICILAFLISPEVESVSGDMEITAENRSEGFMNNFQKCDELRRSLSLPLVDVTSNLILKSGNHSEVTQREIFEKCHDFNGTVENPVLNSTRFDTVVANGTTVSPCRESDANCTAPTLLADYSVLNSTRFDAVFANGTTASPCRESDANCTATTHNHAYDRNLVFVYVLLMITYLSSWSSIFRFMDVTIMSFSRSHDIDFGRERTFSMFGQIVINFLAGIVLDQFTTKGGDRNYKSVYAFCASLLCLEIAAVYCIKAQIKPQSRHMWRDGFRFIRNWDVFTFIAVIFLLGSSFGFFNYFSAWFLEYLDAPAIVFGLQETVVGLYGLPFFLTSKLWLRVFSTQQLLVMGFLGYAIFGIGFSVLYEPWWSLLIQTTSILTYHMLWVAVVVHSHSIAPESLVATIIAIAGWIHYSLGGSIGTLSYGLAVDAVGPRTTFRIVAGINVFSAICYVLFLCTRKSKTTHPSARSECY